MKYLLRTLLVLAPMALTAQVVGSKHDLTSGSGIRYTGTDQVCIFCHTPHNAGPSTGGPLWNHTAGTAAAGFTTYVNTAGVSAGAPGAVSLACLSCHDGTVAVGSLLPGNPSPLTFGLNGQPAGNWNVDRMSTTNAAYVGTDLRSDHPIGVTLPVNSGYKTTAVVTGALPGGGLKLYTLSNNVECASCHAVHDPGTVAAGTYPFLRKSNSASALCTTCHNK